MTCDNCHQRPAKYHVTHVVNGERTEEDLCEECALQKGDLSVALAPLAPLHQLLAGLLQGAAPVAPRTAQEVTCPSCGLRLSEFARTGMLGCADCYDTFAEALRPLVRRLQVSRRHNGKLPRRAAQGLARRRELTTLRDQLKAAVEKEEFERAAELRDRIRALERSESDERAQA